jgi:phage gpG-like protein
MPSSPRTTVEVRGATKAAVDLHRLGQRGSDIRLVAEKVRTIYLRSTKRRFETNGAGEWAELAESTKERKLNEGLDPRILRATNELYRSLTSRVAPEQVDKREKTAFRFGTSVPYARFHNYGKGRMDRELIKLTPAERQQVSKLIGAYVAKAET